MNFVRSRPVMAALLILIMLLSLTGVAYALSKALGFIPGIGIVEPTSLLRTIDAPVFVDRDGVRVTFLNVVANETNTSIRFQVEFLNPPENTTDIDASCQGNPSLTTLNGNSISFIQTKEKFSVGEPGPNLGYGYVMEFAPIPADQNDVTFQYPCLVPLVSGPLPRDWQIPIHLIPAPEGLALPVVTVSVVPTVSATEIEDTQAQTQPAEESNHHITASLDSFVPMEDGYLLIGSLQWSASEYPAYGVNPVPFQGYINVTDAAGQSVPWEEVFGSSVPQAEAFRSYWAIKLLSKTFTAPLTIKLQAVDVDIQPIDFTFDVGSAPHTGQSWELDQALQVADSQVKVRKADLIAADGNLKFQLEVEVNASEVGDLYITSPLGQCMGGGGGHPMEQQVLFQVNVPLCRPDLPAGSVELQVTGAMLWGEWQIQWQP